MIDNKEKVFKKFQLGNYVLKYSGNNIQLVEILTEDITGIFFLRKGTYEVVGKFLIIENGMLDIQELYSTHYIINGNEIILTF